MHRRCAPILFLLVALAMVAAWPGSASAATSPPSAARIDAYLVSKGSPMAGQGAAFIASGGRWRLDPRLIVAIAGAESNFGAITCAPYNAWGWGCPNGPYDFDSWADGIDTVSKGLRENYLSEGRTSVALIHQKYAPVGAANDPTGLNNHWTINVSRFMVELGGDPNDVDLDGTAAAGLLQLGPLPGQVGGYDFLEAQPTGSRPARALVVRAGEPRPLVVEVRNTGSEPWNAADVRLRRVDIESRVVGAPYGALASEATIPPDGVARFVVQLAAAGDEPGRVSTTWRLEGPSGLFGSELVRDVRIAVPAFVAGESRIERAVDATGVTTFVVHVRNAGSEAWLRDGDSGVLLGLQSASGDAYAAEGWINERAAARMLEREVAPGEEASFAFRVRGTNLALSMRPFRTSGWAAGAPVEVELGAPQAAS